MTAEPLAFGAPVNVKTPVEDTAGCTLNNNVFELVINCAGKPTDCPNSSVDC